MTLIRKACDSDSTKLTRTHHCLTPNQNVLIYTTHFKKVIAKLFALFQETK